MSHAQHIISIPFRWLEGMTAWIYIMSVLDGIMTIFWVLTKCATEANPLMNTLIMHDPVLFMVVKILLVSLGIALLWRRRGRPLAIVGILLCFVVYGSIMIHHINAVGRLLIAGTPHLPTFFVG